MKQKYLKIFINFTLETYGGWWGWGVDCLRLPYVINGQSFYTPSRAYTSKSRSFSIRPLPILFKKELLVQWYSRYCLPPDLTNIYLHINPYNILIKC